MSTPASDPVPTPPTTPPSAEPSAAPDAPTPDQPEPQLGDAGIKALQAERARATKAENDFKALQKQIEDSQKSAEQKTAEALAAAQASANEAAAKALRYEVAADIEGFPIALAARLVGATREELQADADRLMSLIPKAPTATPSAPPAGPTVPGQQPGSQQTPALVTQADIDALGAAGKYDEINRLRREGRLSHLGVAPPKAI
jgi:hypothetical protein